MTVIDDYARHPIMKPPRKPRQELLTMRELAAHYAKKITTTTNTVGIVYKKRLHV
jgi:hypothetical protein